MKNSKDIYNMKLIDKILAITNEIEAISKNGVNSKHNYKYAIAADVTNAVRPLLIKHGVLITSSVEIISVNPHANGGYLSNIKLKFNLTDKENPNDILSYDFAGQGYDSTDKGLYKAITSATKYFYISLFKLEIDDDVENEKTEPVKTNGAYKPQTYQAYEKEAEARGIGYIYKIPYDKENPELKALWGKAKNIGAVYRAKKDGGDGNHHSAYPIPGAEQYLIKKPSEEIQGIPFAQDEIPF